jgi:SAM-dependent methyltransferase
MAQENITDKLKSWNKLDRYSRWIYHMYADYIGTEVLDIGGGIGTAIDFYIRNVKRVVTTELFDNQVDILRERFEEFSYFTAVKADIMKDDMTEYGKFNTIVLIQVLEHIEDDVQALVNLKELMTDDGLIIVCVPAVSGLYCHMDKNVGHYRRYQKGELREKAIKAGLKVREDKYMNVLGIIPYWIKGKAKKDIGGSCSTSIGEGESKLYSLATSIMEPLERVIKPPIGLSEFIILEK